MNPFEIGDEIAVSSEGARRLRSGHLWVYSGDVIRDCANPSPPLVSIIDPAGHRLGYGFYSGKSLIRARLLCRGPEPPGRELFERRLRRAFSRRQPPTEFRTAGRLVYAEADLLPSIVVDRYGDYLTLQTLSCGAEAFKAMLLEILLDELKPRAVVERNDVRARELEGLPQSSGVLWGDVPEQVEIREEGAVFLVDLLKGQKTGFFLDQSENRLAASRYVSGRALDCFTNTGAFAIHFAARCESVTAVEASKDSLTRARRNLERNGIQNVDLREGNVFDFLKEQSQGLAKYRAICLDPPAFAKNRAARRSAAAGYKEINLRALKLLEPDGILVTSSCSYHIAEEEFFRLVCAAARDAHRQVQVLERRSQASDHPVLASMPETHYLKCFILRVL